MKYTIVTPTFRTEIQGSLMIAKMQTANTSDFRDEQAQLIDERGVVLQTSYPMLVKGEGYERIAEGYGYKRMVH